MVLEFFDERVQALTAVFGALPDGAVRRARNAIGALATANRDRWITPNISEGELRISDTAFGDPDRKPSVDRALICDPWGGCEFTQQAPENSVLRLTVLQVREIRELACNDERGRPKSTHRADVHANPIEEPPPPNPAHCEIRLQPEGYSGQTFKRLMRELARAADWCIKPTP